MSLAQESIQGAASWFLQAHQHAAGLAAQLAAHAAGQQDHQKQLHTLYLANDLLLKGWAHLVLHVQHVGVADTSMGIRGAVTARTLYLSRHIPDRSDLFQSKAGL